MQSDADSFYSPITGVHFARTSEEVAELYAGFPELIVELRQQSANGPLSPADQDELRRSEEILTRSAPWLLPSS